MTDYDGSALRQLMGAEVESIVFVRDYLQITLYLPQCSPRLTFYIWPTVMSSDDVGRGVGDAEYRNELTRLIGSFVAGTKEHPGSGLVLRFDTGQSLVVQPARSELTGPEIAMLQMNDDGRQWTVWRPGEYPFKSDCWA